MSDTIFALATAPGRAAVAVVRVSGPGAGAILDSLAGGRPAARFAAVRGLRDRAGRLLDRALVLWFPAPASYTGEDCAELHLHGGAGVVDAVTRSLLDSGLRLAEPGEFTRRAFENGKLDLSEAEAVGDLIDAQSEAQVRQALGQLDGALARRYAAWRDDLLEGLARLEAAVDFPDEGLAPDVAETARLALTRILGDLDAGLAEASRGRRVREGYRIAIIGAPNAGKSSLFNALVGRDAAIVAPTTGTTRDVVEATLEIAGYRATLADTAGLGVTNDPVEAEGVRRAKAWATQADLRLWVVDRSDRVTAWRSVSDLLRPEDVCILNKADLSVGPAAAAARRMSTRCGLSVVESSRRGPAAARELRWLEDRVLRDLTGADFPAATRERHRTLLCEGRGHVARALSHLDSAELAAEDVRLAIRSLSRVTGRIGAEEVLGWVFAAFCIGK